MHCAMFSVYSKDILASVAKDISLPDPFLCCTHSTYSSPTHFLLEGCWSLTQHLAEANLRN